jgi:hypothetical protein
MKDIALGMLAAVLLLLAQPGLATAGPGGGKGGSGFKSGSHGHHPMNHKGHWWKNNNNWWYATNNGQLWWQNNKWRYYGYGGVYATQPAVTETVAVPVAVAVETVRPCQRIQQPMTVRSEEGGERVISVTRCQN